MSKYACLHAHSFFSLLDGLGNPKEMAKKAARLEMPAIALTDHGNLGGSLDFFQAVKKAGVRPILGVEAYLVDGDPTTTPKIGRPYNHLVILAKNLAGWQQVIKAVSRSNQADHFYYNPRLSLEEFRDFAQDGNLIAISGHPGSDLGSIIFSDAKKAYSASTMAEVKALVREDAPEVLLKKIEQYVSVFGRENFFLEVQILDPVRMPACLKIASALRWASKQTGIPCVATADSHYVDRRDAEDQRVLLCSKLHTTLSEVERKLAADEDVGLAGFFQSDCFHIPTVQELEEHHPREEIEQSLRIAEMCGDYDILSQPRLPSFPCPQGMSEISYLRELCQSGFERKLQVRGVVLDRPEEEYRDRLQMELGVIGEAGLAPYFLIVQDITRYGRERGWLLGPARGSSAGSLIAYLTGITQVNPLPYSLLFERFYNAGRNSPGRVSLPDIDLDFPIIKRDEVFRYLQRTYGHDKVAKIATFASLQGRSAIDAVLSARGIDYDLRKQITSVIPDKARIAEELQDMKERGEEPSIIRYALDVYADELSEWATMTDDGRIEGVFGPHFAQAIRLEGTKTHQGTHAAGVVISSVPLGELCPLIYDKVADANVAAMEYPALEAMGLVKLDLLGIAMLNKGEGVQDMALQGWINNVSAV